MNKIDFLEQIEVKVKDIAEEISKATVTTGIGMVNHDNTIFPVDSVTGFEIGDEIYLNNRSGRALFTRVMSITQPDLIEVQGDQTIFQQGTLIKKTDADKFLAEAITVYSRYNPLEKVVKKTNSRPGNVFDVPDDWETGFSTINSIEYPIGYIPPYYLSPDKFEIYLDDSGFYKIRFYNIINSSYIINYNIQYMFDFSNPPVSTIPDSDFYCVCNIAAGYYLLALANRYGQNVNPSIGTSTINYDDKTEKYRKLSAELLLQAASWMGLNVKDGFFFEQTPSSLDQNVKS